MKDFVNKQERGKGKWKTAFLVLQDPNGNVFVDNRTDFICDQIERRATLDDGIYMLRTALVEFESDRQRKVIFEAVKEMLTKGASDGVS